MFEILIRISGVVLPVFVFLTMFNVGLTQKLHDIVKYLRDQRFALRMISANFVLAPALMWVMLYFFLLNPYLSAGLTIFSLPALLSWSNSPNSLNMIWPWVPVP